MFGIGSFIFFPLEALPRASFSHGGVCSRLFLGPWIFLVYSVEAWNEDIGSLDMSGSTHSVYDRLVLRTKCQQYRLSLDRPI